MQLLFAFSTSRNNFRFSSSPRFARKINKLSSTSSTTSESSGRQPLYLDVEAPDHPTNLRKSSSGTSLSSQTSVSLSKPVRPESAGDKTNRRTQSSLVVNSDQSEAQLTRNQPHHRPRLDLHDTAHPRFISRYLSLLPCLRLYLSHHHSNSLFSTQINSLDQSKSQVQAGIQQIRRIPVEPTHPYSSFQIQR